MLSRFTKTKQILNQLILRYLLRQGNRWELRHSTCRDTLESLSILLGRICCPEGKDTRGLQCPVERCPTSPTPHLHGTLPGIHKLTEHKNLWSLIAGEGGKGEECVSSATGLYPLPRHWSTLQMRSGNHYWIAYYSPCSTTELDLSISSFEKDMLKIKMCVNRPLKR